MYYVHNTLSLPEDKERVNQKLRRSHRRVLRAIRWAHAQHYVIPYQIISSHTLTYSL